MAVLLYFFVAVMASSPACHRIIHPDADQGDHHCAATLLSRGQVDAASIVVIVVRPIFVQSELVLPEAPETTAIKYRLLPERAPPSHLS